MEETEQSKTLKEYYINKGGNYLVSFFDGDKSYLKGGYASNFIKRMKSLKREFEIKFLFIIRLALTGDKMTKMDTKFRHLIENNNLSANYKDRFGSKKREIYIISGKVIDIFDQYYNKHDTWKCSKITKSNDNSKIFYNEIDLNNLKFLDDTSSVTSDGSYDRATDDSRSEISVDELYESEDDHTSLNQLSDESSESSDGCSDEEEDDDDEDDEYDSEDDSEDDSEEEKQNKRIRIE